MKGSEWPILAGVVNYLNQYFPGFEFDDFDNLLDSHRGEDAIFIARALKMAAASTEDMDTTQMLIRAYQSPEFRQRHEDSSLDVISYVQMTALAKDEVTTMGYLNVLSEDADFNQEIFNTLNAAYTWAASGSSVKDLLWIIDELPEETALLMMNHVKKSYGARRMAGIADKLVGCYRVLGEMDIDPEVLPEIIGIADPVISQLGEEGTKRLWELYDTDKFTHVLSDITDKQNFVSNINVIAYQSKNIQAMEQLVDLLYGCKDRQKMWNYISIRLHHLHNAVADFTEFMQNLPLSASYVGELLDRLIDEDGSALAEVSGSEQHFLRQQPEEYVFPLAVIMCEVEDREMIKSLDGWVLDRLTQAYSIARDNWDKETRMNYLPQFYDGLKECLEKRPQDVEKWAASITSDFSKQGEKGLLRGVVG